MVVVTGSSAGSDVVVVNEMEGLKKEDDEEDSLLVLLSLATRGSVVDFNLNGFGAGTGGGVLNDVCTSAAAAVDEEDPTIPEISFTYDKDKAEVPRLGRADGEGEGEEPIATAAADTDNDEEGKEEL